MQTFEMSVNQETRKNHRVFVRSMFPKETNIKYHSLGSNAERQGVLHSISQAGAYVKSERLPEVGTQLELFFKFGARRIQCQGRVIYHNLDEGELSTRGFGVKFTRMISDDYSSIKKILDEFFLMMRV